MANKHMKCYSKIIDMQIKTPVRHYFVTISLVIIKKNVIKKLGCWCTVGGNVKCCHHYGKQ